ncbi:MAG: response regulator [Pseudomonadota bacterium]|nr:response regulator [Pseudomonadota bacterium]
MKRLRALIVEDSPTILEALCGLLEDHDGIEVVGTAVAAAEACAWLDSRTQACDVAIVDLFLQSGSGLGVLEHIAGYARPPERIVLTNYATPEVRRRCEALGAAAVFDKSTEIEGLVDWLNSRVHH